MDSLAIDFGNIWIPPTGRPYWKRLNKKGNVGPHLTDEELDSHNLSEYKQFPYDEIWAKAWNKGNE